MVVVVLVEVAARNRWVAPPGWPWVAPVAAAALASPLVLVSGDWFRLLGSDHLVQITWFRSLGSDLLVWTVGKKLVAGRAYFQTVPLLVGNTYTEVSAYCDEVVPKFSPGLRSPRYQRPALISSQTNA